MINIIRKDKICLQLNFMKRSLRIKISNSKNKFYKKRRIKKPAREKPSSKNSNSGSNHTKPYVLYKTKDYSNFIISRLNNCS